MGASRLRREAFLWPDFLSHSPQTGENMKYVTQIAVALLALIGIGIARAGDGSQAGGGTDWFVFILGMAVCLWGWHQIPDDDDVALRPRAPYRAVRGVIYLMFGFIVMLMAHRAEAAPVQVPDSAALYRHYVEQAASDVWGVEASPARLAAQIHQESSWQTGARSTVGAQGLAQFMPATAKWIAQQFPDQLGDFDPWDPRQAALAAALYDHWLLVRNDGATQCDCWAFALSAYNGGEARLHAEQIKAGNLGANSRRWFGEVAVFRARGVAAWQQNRGYVNRILRVLEPAYIADGWSGTAVCG